VSQGAPTEEKLDAKGLRVAVCHTRWNGEFVEALVAGTLAELKACGAQVEPVRACSGVFELAPLCARVARKGGIDGIIAIGCIIEGETDHYTLLANESTRALGMLALELGTNPQPVALTFGVLACHDKEQARARRGNGREFARTCISQALALRAVGD
jgi:6,7-dimethyl-8-ribityllumazine synthase